MNISRARTRLFVNAPLAEGAEFALPEMQAHFLRATLRCKEGEYVLVFNGKDGEWRARIGLVGKRDVSLVAEAQTLPQKTGPDVWLAFAPVKNEKIDYTARRATEMGVSALFPVLTERTAVSRVNVERLRANVAEAAEQCGRLDVPEVRDPRPLAPALDDWPPARLLLFCDESGEGASVRALLPMLPPGPCGVLIGPEGGFSPAEQAFIRALPFARGLSLGPRILRAETAALAALAHAQAWLGDGDEKPRFTGKDE